MYWKYHDSERIKIRATVFLKWTDFSKVIILQMIEWSDEFELRFSKLGQAELSQAEPKKCQKKSKLVNTGTPIYNAAH